MPGSRPFCTVPTSPLSLLAFTSRAWSRTCVLALSVSSPSSMPDQSFPLSSCVFCTSVLLAGSVRVVEDTLGLWAAVVRVYSDQISLKWYLRGLGWLYAKLDATAF